MSRFLQASVTDWTGILQMPSHIDPLSSQEPIGSSPSSQQLHRLLGEPRPRTSDKSVTKVATTDAPSLTPDERYSLAPPFARGGLGQIRRAYDHVLQRVVAVKELHNEKGSKETSMRLEREAKLAARLEHPSIIPVYDFGRYPDGTPYYCMRLVQGRPLTSLIHERTTERERIGLLPHVIAVADAIAYAHTIGIIHRDLKPDNVLVGEFGQTVVIDWGLAKQVQAGETPDIDEATKPQVECGYSNSPLVPASDNVALTTYQHDLTQRLPPPLESAEPALTRAGQLLGTIPYMPPEQAAGDAIDTRADVYAIGAILYHVLAGRPPFADVKGTAIHLAVLDAPPTDIALLSPETPEDLHAIVRKAMAKSRALRYASAADLADDLKRFQAGQLVSAREYSLREVLRRRIGRHRYLVSAASATLVVLLSMAIFSYIRIERQRAIAEESASAASTAKTIAEKERDASRKRARELQFKAAQTEFEREHPLEAAALLTEIFPAMSRDVGAQILLGEAMRIVNATESVLEGHNGGAIAIRFGGPSQLAVISGDGALHLWNIDEAVLEDIVELPGMKIEDARYTTKTSSWRLEVLEAPDAKGSSSAGGDVDLDASSGILRTVPERMSIYSDGTGTSFTLRSSHVLSAKRIGKSGDRDNSLIRRVSKVWLIDDRSGSFGSFMSLPTVLADPEVIVNPEPPELFKRLQGLEETQQSPGIPPASAPGPNTSEADRLDSVESLLLFHAEDDEALTVWEIHAGEAGSLLRCPVAEQRSMQELMTGPNPPPNKGTLIVHRPKIRTWNASNSCHWASLPEVGEIEAIDLSSDGAWIALAGRNGFVHVLDASRLVVVGSLLCPGRVRDLRFSPDGSRLAAALGSGSVLVWRRELMERLRWGRNVLTIERFHEHELAFVESQGVRRSAVATLDYTRVDDPVEVPIASESPADVLWSTYPSDGLMIGSASFGELFDILDVSQRRRLAMFAPKSPRSITGSLGPSADRRHVLFELGQFSENVGSYQLLYWNADLSRLTHQSKSESRIEELSPDSARMLLNTRDKRDWFDLRETLTGHLRLSFEATHADFSPDGQRIFTQDRSGSVKVLDVASLVTHTLVEGQIAGRIQLGGEKVVYHTPDQSLFLLPRHNGVISVHDASTLLELGALQGHEMRPNYIAFSADGTRAVTYSSRLSEISGDSRAILWDLDELTPLARIDRAADLGMSTGFSPDSELLAVGCPSGRVDLWNATDGTFLLSIPITGGFVSDIWFTGDGLGLVIQASGRDGRSFLGVWRLPRESRPAEVLDHHLAEFSRSANISRIEAGGTR